MNRSLRLLRPLGHTRPLSSASGLGLGRSALKPQMPLQATPSPLATPVIPKSFPAMAIRLYVAPSVPVRADDKKGKDQVAPSLPVRPKENPNADDQRATSGPVEEVGSTFVD